MTVIIGTIQVRRGDSAEWAAANPVLASGEWGLDITVAQVKMGNGMSTWSALPFLGGPVFTGDVTLEDGSLIFGQPFGYIAFNNWEGQIYYDSTEMGMIGSKVVLQGPVRLNNGAAGGAPTVDAHLTTKKYVDSRIVEMTQAAYDALTPKLSGVLYVIVG